MGGDRGSRSTQGREGNASSLDKSVTRVIFFSFEEKQKARVAGDSPTCRLHGAKADWAPAQTRVDTVTKAGVDTMLGRRRK